jgi:GNAT superfamily N-acetyltransferase
MKIVPYSEEFREGHRDFATQMWPHKRRRREELYQRWKFRGSAHGPVEGLLLAVEGSRVLGQLGLIPASLRVGDTIYPCQWACDLMVDSSLRRRGVGTLLLEAAMARDVMTLGSNPSPAADITMSRLGFKALIGPRIMVLPLKLNHVLGWVMPSSLRKAIPVVSTIGQPVATFRYRSLTKRKIEESVTSSDWEEILPLVTARQSANGHPHVVHDRGFMEWRCSGLSGYTAKLENLRVNDGFAVVGAASDYYYVYEWAARSKESFLALFRAIFHEATSAKSQTIQVLANDEHEEQWLREVGFIGMRNRFKVICYPSEKLIPEYDKFYYSIYDSDGNL